MFPPVKKAVIPAAGFGTRMLPFTKAVPKELIPLVDKPVIQYVVEEAVAAGISDILIVISSGKEAIMRHFNPVPELEERLASRQKTEVLARLQSIDRLARIHYVYQQQLNGLGDAVLQAQSFVGGDPFAVLLGDTVMESFTDRSVTGQLIDVYRRYGSSVVAVEQVPKEKISKYGVVGGTPLTENVTRVETMIEKPAPEKAPSDLAVAARYLFTPEIFSFLARTKPGVGGEIQLTDAMRAMLSEFPLCACRIGGHRHDLGSKAGFVAANVEFAMRDESIAAALLPQLKKWLKE